MLNYGIILPLYYIPPISSFSLFYHAPAVRFFLPARFVKQSFFQRTCIKAPNHKIETLSIPLAKKSSKEYYWNLSFKNELWINKHLNAIKYAYEKSAFFFHFFPTLEKILSLHKNLLSLNYALYKWLAQELNLEHKLYLESRHWFFVELPRKKYSLDWFYPKKYYQFFGKFAEDLGVLDLLMHYALEARLYFREVLNWHAFQKRPPLLPLKEKIPERRLILPPILNRI